MFYLTSLEHELNTKNQITKSDSYESEILPSNILYNNFKIQAPRGIGQAGRGSGYGTQASQPLPSHIRDALSDLCSKMSSPSWVCNHLKQQGMFWVMKHLHLQPDCYIAHMTFSREPCSINPWTLDVFTTRNLKPETPCQKQYIDTTPPCKHH